MELRPRFYVLAVIALALLGVLVAIVTNIATDQMPDWFEPYQSFSWCALAALALLFGVLTWATARQQQSDAIKSEPSHRHRKPSPTPVVPKLPEPYFAHPYPLQPNFTGRVNERQMLTEWLVNGREPVFALTAIGGMGKSALTWAWLQHDVLGFRLPATIDEAGVPADASRVPEDSRPDGVLWWSFYEHEAGFPAFLEHAIVYISSGRDEPSPNLPYYERVRLLVNLLQERRLLIVLDGLERILRAYARMDAAYRGDEFDRDERGDFCCCTDPHASDFLGTVASLPMPSRVLLTSRLFPRELENLAGCRRKDLNRLSSEDAIAFFRAQGVRGTRAEVKEACAPYGYHPLALRLLAGVIAKDKRKPGDIQVARRYPVLPELKGKEQHHILQVAYDTLDSRKRILLSRIAAFRSPMTYETLSIFNVWMSERKFDAALDELIARGLLFYDNKQGRYDLHPIVRQHAYDRMADKQGVHTRLRDYFASVPSLDKADAQSVEDLAPVIELYHHTVRARRYGEAQSLFHDRLQGLLYFRFGAYQTCIELLRGLFPDGEDRLPPLKNDGDIAWTLNELAVCYSLSGLSRRAIPLLEAHNSLQESVGHYRNLAIGLSNLGMDQILLGDLKEATSNLRRGAALYRELGEGSQATERFGLSRILSYQDRSDEAEPEIRWALGSQDGSQYDQPLGPTLAYRAVGSILAGDTRAGIDAARQAYEVATCRQNERNRITSEWALGWSLLALDDEGGQSERLVESETHLTEALTRCRRITLVELEPDILLAWGRWHRLRGNPKQARKDALEALSIADRCEYRLKQADIHNFLARLDIEAGDRESAIKHAQTGYERAWCDGPPHCYRPALDEAERLLNELGAPKPKMPDA